MKLGFIGTGNMAGAIMGGIIKNGVLKPEEIIGSDILEAGAVWKRCQDRAHHAEYTGNGRCRDDGSVCKCSGYKRRVGKSADNPALFRRGRSRIRASDRCSCVCKRKFSGICIYDDRSNGRCGSGRWNAKTSGV